MDIFIFILNLLAMTILAFCIGVIISVFLYCVFVYFIETIQTRNIKEKQRKE